MLYRIFSLGAIFIEKFSNQNWGFWNFQKIKNTAILYGKIKPLGWVYDFFPGVYLLAFSVGFVVAYSIFSVGAILVEKFAKQNCRILEFSKNQKNGEFVRQNLALRLRLWFFSWCLSISIFRWLCRGIQHFFCRCHICWEICKTMLPLFRVFKKNWKMPILNGKFLFFLNSFLIIFSLILRTVPFIGKT